MPFSLDIIRGNSLPSDQGVVRVDDYLATTRVLGAQGVFDPRRVIFRGAGPSCHEVLSVLGQTIAHDIVVNSMPPSAFHALQPRYGPESRCLLKLFGWDGVDQNVQDSALLVRVAIMCVGRA